MKKFLTLCLAAALCLTAILSASAETEMNLKYTLDGVEWIENTDLLKMQGSNGYAVTAVDGTALTSDVYDYGIYMEYGFLTVSDLSVGDMNCRGLLRLDGTEVIPCRYGDVDVMSNHWAAAVTVTAATADQYDYETYDNEYFLIDTVELYNLETGESVAQMPRAEFKEASANGTVLNVENRTNGVISAYDADFRLIADDLTSIYDSDHGGKNLVSFDKNGQEGLMDDAGNIIMEPKFYMVHEYACHSGAMTVSDGEKEGLIDIEGNVILEPLYDDIDYSYHAPFNGEDNYAYINNGYIAVITDDKLGYADVNGNVTCEPKYSTDLLDNNGCSSTFTDLEGSTVLLAADGVETVLEHYESIYAMKPMGGLFYEVQTEGYNYGIIDWHGNTIVPCEYYTVEFSGDGRWLLLQKEYDSPCEIYEVNFGTAPAAEEAPAEEVPAEKKEGKEVVLKNNPAEEAPAGEAPASELIESAIELLKADPNNGEAVKGLLDAAAALESGNEGVLSVLSSASALMDADPAANSAAVITLLETVKGLL